MPRLPFATMIVLVAFLFAGSCERRNEPSSSSSNTTTPLSTSQSDAGTFPPEITTSVESLMVLIPAGAIMMGADDEVDSAPVHQVSVDAFYMDRYEVTQAVYEQVMGHNPARRIGARNPVERVRWTDVIKFCNKLSENEGLKPCYDLQTWSCDFAADGYRLPTEAEWEYACRAGTQGDFYFDGGAGQLDKFAWHKGNARRKHQPVGQKEPNSFGLYDMLGNVREWCNDLYAPDYYANSPAANPRGPESGDKAVLRGGAFSTTASSCTCWSRYCDEAGFTDACVASNDYGFRCVRRPKR